MNKRKRKNVLLTNLLIKQEYCDSACKYCYHQTDENYHQCADEYLYDGELKSNLIQILNFTTQHFFSPIVKICGGEIFLMKNMKDFVEKLLSCFPYVLIQTNGRHIDDDYLKWIIQSKRILIQMSLDGHDLEMNTYRFTEESIMKKMIHTITQLKKNDVYLELTTVLNNANTSRFEEFVSYLHDIPAGRVPNILKVTPILLIDKEGKFTPSADDIKVVESLIGRYGMYQDILPPKAYLIRLHQLLNNERLNYQCYNPIVSVNYIDDGKIKGCTNILPMDALNVGNVFTDNPDAILKRFGKTKFQKLMLETKQWVPLCRNCFNFCSIYNLYLNDTITLDELSGNNYMFRLPEVNRSLREIKASIASNNKDAETWALQ